ncbi:MAG: energy transducer TonB [Lysobacter sp.]|nr:energy transducer TonB [Lysobacter sp.]
MLTSVALLAGVAGAAEPVAFRAEARVEIDVTGKPTKIEASADLPDAVRTCIERKVATWQFAPPSQDGVTGSGVTYLTLGACAVPEGSGYRMAIDFKGNGPGFAGRSILPPPRYPVEAMRAGREAQLLVRWVAETDGRATLERVERTDKAKVGRTDIFEKAIREWVASLRYEPEYLAGKPVRTRVEVPVNFMMSGARTSGAIKRELLEHAAQSPERSLAASKVVDGLQPVAVDSPFKLLTSG